MSNILRIDASGRHEGSSSRALANALIKKMDGANVTHRDLATDAPDFVNAEWIGANFTDESARSDAQKAALAVSDALIAEIEAADTIVIASPVYNFGVPAALKAWIDMVCRARKTFQYTPNGPEGLLTGKKAYLMMASGGTKIGSEIDFASGYLKHIMGFIGISDVTIIAADQQMAKGEEAVVAASAEIEKLTV